jgi:hypothetical protein
VPGAGDLEHDGGQPVPHVVVDVAGDPATLRRQGLLRELAPRRVELRREPPLADGGAAEEPREDDAHRPDARRHLRRVLQQHGGHGRERGEDAEGGGRRERRRPERDDEAEQGRLEQQRLEVPLALRRDDGDQHGEGQRRQRHRRRRRPCREGGDGQRGEEEAGPGVAGL